MQINRFGYGEAFERNPQEGTYPLLWVVPLPYNISGVDCDYMYRLVVLDRVRKDESDELEVESDTDKILKDSLSYLCKYCQQNDLELIENFTFTPTYEQDNDEVTGFYTDVTIRDTFDYSSCALPIAGEIPDNEWASNYVYTNPTLRDKSVVISSPQLTDDVPFFYTHDTISIRQVNDVVAGISPELSYNIYFAASKTDPTPTKLWAVDRVATSEAGTETETFTNTLIPSNSWVWLIPSAKNGQVDILSVTIFFKKVNN